MMPSSPPRPLIWRLLEAYCGRFGLTLHQADDLGYAGWIETKSGKRSFFSGASFDLNSLGAAQIARDKAHTLSILQRAGLPVPASLLVHSSQAIADMDRSYPHGRELLAGAQDGTDFAEKTGYPVYVKPNDGREGRDVHRAMDADGLAACFDSLFLRHNKLLVQQEVRGRDMRLLVLDGKILCALERMRPELVGDGHSTVAELLAAQPNRVRTDSRLFHELMAQNLTYCAVPAAGTRITLLPVANLSAGGKAGIWEGPLPQEIEDAAIACGRELGLRYYGLDLLFDKNSCTESSFRILEVNAAPGLSQLHRQGGEAATLVESLYARVFDALRENLEAAG